MTPSLPLDIKELPAEHRPRERIMTLGPGALTDLELMTLLLGSGSKEKPVSLLANELLGYLDAHGSQPINARDLCTIKGLGFAKASIISAALEIGRRLNVTRKRQITTPEDVFPLIQHYGTRQQEHFISISLNGAHEVITTTVVSVGLVNRTLVHPREVFSPAVAERATAVIVAHNHPSGNLDPSEEDVIVTKRLITASEIIGIKLLDHVVFDDTHFISLMESGQLA